MKNSYIIIENDAALFGILLIILGIIFYTSNIKTKNYMLLVYIQVNTNEVILLINSKETR